MKEAMEAVEARERGRPPPEGAAEIEVEVEAEARREPPERQEAAKPPSDPPEPAPAVAPDAAQAAQATLAEALANAEAQVKELKDKWLRAAADLDNFRKRAGRERDDAVKFGNERLLRDLLPVLDDLDRSIQALEAGEQGTQTGSLLEGVRLVQKKFVAQLEKNGVEGFSAKGQVFDPNQHEAVQQVYSDEVPAGAVAAELRRGFFLAGRLLRPAMVAVSLGSAPKGEA